MDKNKFIKILEFSCLPCFGLTYWWYRDLQPATIVLIITTTLFMGMALLLRQPLSKMQKISWVFLLVFGGASILSQDDNWMKWKPTVLYFIVGIAFSVTNFIGRETLVEKLARSHIKAPKVKLRRLNIGVGLCFFFLAAANLFVAT